MPRYYCVAEGCSSNSRKKGRYGFMADVEFFPFPLSKHPKVRRKWLRRRDFEPSRHDRICSMHFVDGQPAQDNPYPELFRYNNFKCSLGNRGTSSIEKRSLQQAANTTIQQRYVWSGEWASTYSGYCNGYSFSGMYSVRITVYLLFEQWFIIDSK